MIYLKLAGKESCDMTVRILYTRVRMTARIPEYGIRGFTFQCYKYWDGTIYIKLADGCPRSLY